MTVCVMLSQVTGGNMQGIEHCLITQLVIQRNQIWKHFLREWTALVESKSGERGIFNRQASKKQADEEW